MESYAYLIIAANSRIRSTPINHVLVQDRNQIAPFRSLVIPTFLDSLRQRHYMHADVSALNVSFDRPAQLSAAMALSDLPTATLFQRSSYLDIDGPRSGRHTVGEVPLTSSHH